MKQDPLEKYGSASRTVTLPIGYWAQLAEFCELEHIDFKTGIKRAIKLAHRNATKTKLENQ